MVRKERLKEAIEQERSGMDDVGLAPFTFGFSHTQLRHAYLLIQKDYVEMNRVKFGWKSFLISTRFQNKCMDVGERS